jgi:hypothetical protein
MTAPRALISGLMEFLSMLKIFTGTVWFWAVAQNRVAVMSSKEMVKENSAPARMAGSSSGKVTSLKV